MNTAIELTYNINVLGVSLRSARPRIDALPHREPNLNLFPASIQNGHINLIIRCVIRLADERLESLDGIKSVLPPLCVPWHRAIKLGRVSVMAHSGVGYASRTSSSRRLRVLVPLQVVRARSLPYLSRLIMVNDCLEFDGFAQLQFGGVAPSGSFSGYCGLLICHYSEKCEVRLRCLHMVAMLHLCFPFFSSACMLLMLKG